MKRAVFIGHNECYELSASELSKAIEDCINLGVTEFFSGGQGRFDRAAAVEVYKLKKNYPLIKNILVVPYPDFNVFDKGLFDEIIYPENFERYTYKSAIPARNKYMVINSNIAICYVNHGWGNAAKTYGMAKRKGLQIINIAPNANRAP